MPQPFPDESIFLTPLPGKSGDEDINQAGETMFWVFVSSVALLLFLATWYGYESGYNDAKNDAIDSIQTSLNGSTMTVASPADLLPVEWESPHRIDWGDAADDQEEEKANENPFPDFNDMLDDLERIASSRRLDHSNDVQLTTPIEINKAHSVKMRKLGLMKLKHIMVLNDGETYTNLDGCFIMAVPADSEMEDIEEILDSASMFDHNPSDFSEGFVVTTFSEMPA